MSSFTERVLAARDEGEARALHAFEKEHLDITCANPRCDAWTPMQTLWSFVRAGTSFYCTDTCADECEYR